MEKVIRFQATKLIMAPLLCELRALRANELLGELCWCKLRCLDRLGWRNLLPGKLIRLVSGKASKPVNLLRKKREN